MDADSDPERGGRARVLLLRAIISGQASTGLVLLGVLVGLALWMFSLNGIHPYRSGPAGLIGELPTVWWLSLVVIVASFVAAITRTRPSMLALSFSLIGLVVILHGTAPAVESTPRWASNVTAGFADYIARKGHILPDFDARFYWPAFFSALGMASRAMDVPTTWFLRGAPLVFNLLYLLPLKALANSALRSERARWTALGLFAVGDWVGQDYLSPQGINLFFYLTVLAVVVRVFSSQRSVAVSTPVRRVLHRASSAIARNVLRVPEALPPRDAPVLPISGGASFGLLAVVLLLVSASVVSHQLTPVALAAALAFLAAATSTTLRSLWLLVLVLVFAWLCWVAQPYWAGHLSEIFGNVGQLIGNVSSNLSAHLGTSVPASHEVVLDTRSAGVGLIAITAVAALWCGLRRGQTNWAMAALLVSPIVLLGGQSYGGEAILRVFLFSLGPACILIAGLLELRFGRSTVLQSTVTVTPARSRRTVLIAPTVVALVGLVLLASFPLTRWGNESFEAVAPTDFQATDWAMAHVPTGSTLDTPVADAPVEYSRLEDFHYGDMTTIVGLRGAALLRAIRALGPNPWVLITRSEDEYGVVNNGYPQGWLTALEESLLATGNVALRYRTATAAVLEILPASGGRS